MMLLGLLIGIQPAAASDVRCETGFGTKVPVLMVHGFNSNPKMWDEGGETSMRAAIEKVDGVTPVEAFSYEIDHFEWVTNQNIGPKLAKTIDCLAQASRANHGRGKVVVIGHSMGGLATRYAANQTIDGRKVADELGLVITLGTPHLGSQWGNAGVSLATSVCQGIVGSIAGPLNGLAMTKDECLANLAIKGLAMDSDEFKSLQPFPKKVPVRAIAGNVSVMTQLLFESMTTPTHSDMVVGVDSASAEFTNKGVGDGRFEFKCYSRGRATLFDSTVGFTVEVKLGECWHNALTKTGYVQESVTNGIREYLKATPLVAAPTGTPHEFFGDMTLYLKSDQQVQGLHGEGPSAYDVACVDKTACPAFSVYRPNEVGGDLGWKSWDLPECSTGQDASTFGPIVSKGTRKIGGKPAKYYEAELCAAGVPRETARFWEATDGSIFVSDTSGNNRWQSDEDKILSAGTWR